jgi:hypothetical protein
MSYIGAQPTTVAFLTDQFSGNGTTTVFTMQVAPASTSSILINITGVTQDPTTYSIVGTTLTFSAAPPTGTNNISVRYLGIPASGVTTTAYRTVTNFTATAGQTSFSVPSYTVGYIDVFRNGVRLVNNGADFVATTGTTVVLNNACTVGDSVVTESFYVSSVLNAIPATAGAVNSTYITDAAVTQAKLAANVAGNGPAFSAWTSGGQIISSGVAAKMAFNTEFFDTNSNFNNTSSTVDSTPAYAFLPTVAGYYHISTAITNTGSAVGILAVLLYKNGAQYLNTQVGNNTQGIGVPMSMLVYLNGTTDYVEIWVYQTTGGNVTTLSGRSDCYQFSGALVRAA